MNIFRMIATGFAALLLLSIPSVIEFATGEATLDFYGIAFEAFETLTLAAAFLAIVFLFTEVRQARKDRESLVTDLVRTREESLVWRENATRLVQGARQAIDNQFEAWQFSPAEKDIAALILKGCSHRQIAEVRNSTVTTVRQQAQSIYRKSGLEGRSELAAYFLDAILDSPDYEPEATAQRAATR